MIFGAVPVEEAQGCILAHSLTLLGGKLAKGTRLTRADLDRLRTARIAEVIVARLEPGDCDENTAADRLGQALSRSDLPATPAHSGRSNLSARRAGVLRVDVDKVNRINAIDEGLTLATLPDFARVDEGTLVATAKIIPYAVPDTVVTRAAAQARDCLHLHPFRRKTYDLILTRTPGFRQSLLEKGQDAVETRVGRLNGVMGQVSHVDHTQNAVADALRAARGDVVLILGASATSDRHDVIPAGLSAAGGLVARFGMPVDPGNLLCLGHLENRPVIGLPGCARAPALNGADWVLERIAADLDIGEGDIAAMGAGGLLKEIPQRRLPREASSTARKGIAIILLAAGASRRMRGAQKLEQDIDGEPLLRRSAKTACAAGQAHVFVVIPKQAKALRDMVADLPVSVVEAEDAALGLSASLKAGLRGLPQDIAAAIISLADMPDISTDHYQALTAAHDPDRDALIATPIAPNGKRGNPVLFDARFIPDLMRLTGDQGARAIIDAARDVVIEVPSDAAVLTDLDTPEAWETWRSNRGQ